MAGSTSFFLKYGYTILIAAVSFLCVKLWKARVQRGVRSALCLPYVKYGYRQILIFKLEEILYTNI